MIVENVSCLRIVAILGGLLGIGLAFVGLRLLVAQAPGNLPRLHDIALDIPVLLFTLVLSVVAGLLFGAMTAFRHSRAELGIALRAGGRTASASRQRHRAGNALVVAQVALALVLLVSAGLMIRTFLALRNVHPGFVRANEVQTVRLSIPDSQVKDEVAVTRMQQAILEKLATIPQVSSVAFASTVTMTGQGWHDPLFAEDHVYAESKLPPIRLFKFVSPGYTSTMGASIVAGREFTWAETYQQRPVAMVSETLARELWGQPSAAIGKRVRPYPQGSWREVIGVISDMRDDGVNHKATAAAYWPTLMTDSVIPGTGILVQRGLTYVVRSRRTGSVGFVNDLAQAVWAINASVPPPCRRCARQRSSRSRR